MRIFSSIIFALAVAVPALTVSAAISESEVSEAVAAAKKSPSNRALNFAAGNALKEAGRYRESIPFYLKANNTANLKLAEVYFQLYDFDRAQEYLDKYVAKRSKAEAAADANFLPSGAVEPVDWTDYLAERILTGRSMLDRVEKVQIIDSVNVPFTDFYRAIRLAAPAGSLLSGEQIENIVEPEWLRQHSVEQFSDAAYVSENGDDVIWVGSDANGDRSTMYESVRLVGGKWDNPVKLFDYNSIFGEDSGSWIDFPFLMSDGVTLYFAADGDKSLGGLDIFISRRDEDGFLQPSNIGMPYNSPDNDYLYAIDEVTGTGWWVTDRNHLGDSVTIYTFIPQDLRINYPVDTPDLASYARVSSIKSTWQEGKDYADVRARIEALAGSGKSRSREKYAFAIPGGRIYTKLEDFNSDDARQAFVHYLVEQKKFNLDREKLASLRLSYHRGDTSVADEIRSLEREIERQRSELRKEANGVIELETGK